MLEESFSIKQLRVETYRVRGYPVISFDVVSKNGGPVNQYRARFYDSAGVEVYNTPLTATLAALNFLSNPAPGEWRPGQLSDVTFLLPDEDKLEKVRTVRIVRTE